mgnify:CR=1 FL=1
MAFVDPSRFCWSEPKGSIVPGSLVQYSSTLKQFYKNYIRKKIDIYKKSENARKLKFTKPDKMYIQSEISTNIRNCVIQVKKTKQTNNNSNNTILYFFRNPSLRSPFHTTNRFLMCNTRHLFSFTLNLYILGWIRYED